jgi:hypothetical protein
MTELKKSVLLPILGQDFSIPSTILNDRSSFGRNCFFDMGIIKQREGLGKYSSDAMSSAILEFGRFQKSNLTLLMTRFSATKSEVYNAGADTWDDITKSGTDWTTIDGTNYYDTAVHIDTLMITNGRDNIQKYTGTGLCVDLGGSPPKAKYIETVGEYVLLGNITDGGTEYPSRVQWCDTGEIEDWSSGNAGFIDLLDNDQQIIGMKKLNENIVVFKEKSIYIGRLVSSTDVYNFDLIESGQQLLNNRCAVVFRGKIYYLSIDGNIYMFNGYSSQPIGNKLEDEIKRVINTDRLGMSFGRVNLARKCIEFFICAGSDSYCSYRWALNYEDGSVFYDTFSSPITCATTFKDSSGQLTYGDYDNSVNYGNVSGTYGDGLGGSGFEFKLIGKSNGISYQESDFYLNDDTDAIEQEFITKDFSFENHERIKRWQTIVNQLLGTQVTLSYSTDFGNTYIVIPYSSSQDEFDLTSAFTSYAGWFDLKSLYIRFKFANLESSSYFSLRQLALYGQIGEEIYR